MAEVMIKRIPLHHDTYRGNTGCPEYTIAELQRVTVQKLWRMYSISSRRQYYAELLDTIQHPDASFTVSLEFEACSLRKSSLSRGRPFEDSTSFEIEVNCKRSVPVPLA